MKEAHSFPPIIPSAAIGGAYYEVAKKFKELLQKHMALDVDVLNTAGSNPNIGWIVKKEGLLSFSSSGPLLEAWVDRQIESVRVLFPMYTASFHGWTLKKEPFTLRDMTDKTIAIGPVGGTSADYLTILLKELGIQTKDTLYIEWDEVNQKLRDGSLDCGVTIGGVPQVSIEEMAKEGNLQIFGMSQSEIEDACQALPFFDASEMAASTYSQQEDPIPGISIFNWAFAHEDLPEDQAYEITRLFFEHLDEMKKVHSGFDYMDIHDIVNSPIPLHTGAKKYYEERGIAIGDSTPAAKMHSHRLNL